MPSEWEEQENVPLLTRRQWIRVGATATGVGAAGAFGAAVIAPLLQPPRDFGLIRDDLYYRRFPTDQWWNDRHGQPVRVTDFLEWQGANAVWRGLFVDDKYIDGTGLPVLVIRVKRDDAVFRAPDPSTIELPNGYSLFYDDPSRDIRIVVCFQRCTHLCCYAGWHVVTDPPPSRDYATYTSTPPPTYAVYGLDPIYCVCHGAQWDPMILEEGVHPNNAARYVGVSFVHGPGWGPLPVVAVRARADLLEGGMIDPRWYAYCE